MLFKEAGNDIPYSEKKSNKEKPMKLKYWSY